MVATAFDRDQVLTSVQEPRAVVRAALGAMKITAHRTGCGYEHYAIVRDPDLQAVTRRLTSTSFWAQSTVTVDARPASV
jgi:hypothetical protein